MLTFSKFIDFVMKSVSLRSSPKSIDAFVGVSVDSVSFSAILELFNTIYSCELFALEMLMQQILFSQLEIPSEMKRAMERFV